MTFSFLTYDIQENSNIGNGEYNDYLTNMYSKNSSINPSISNIAIKINSKNREQEKTFVNELKNKYTYLDTTVKSTSITDVQNQEKTKKTIGSGKTNVIRAGYMKSTTMHYNTGILLVYDKSEKTLSVLDESNDKIIGTYTNIYNAQRIRNSIAEELFQLVIIS